MEQKQQVLMFLHQVRVQFVFLTTFIELVSGNKQQQNLLWYHFEVVFNM